MSKWRSFKGSMLAFAALGPAVGHFAFTVCSWIEAAFSKGPDVSLDTTMTIWFFRITFIWSGLPFAYVYGFVPAVVSGAVVSALFLGAPSLMQLPRRQRGAIASAIGAVVSVWGSTLWISDAMTSFDDLWFGFIIAGAVASFVVGSYFPRGSQVTPVER